MFEMLLDFVVRPASDLMWLMEQRALVPKQLLVVSVVLQETVRRPPHWPDDRVCAVVGPGPHACGAPLGDGE